MHMPLPQEWIDRLNLSLRVGRDLFTEVVQTQGHPYGETMRKALDAGVSGVFCLGGQPCAAVVLLSQNYEASWLRELYTDLWNQGELDFLLLLSPEKVEVHTLDADPRNLPLSAPISPTILKILQQAGEIEEIITGLESGRFLKKRKKGLNAEARVDASLIRDLEGARARILAAEGFGKLEQAPKELIEQIHDVLLQAMFLLYLEDRGIIEAEYIHLHGNSQFNKLHELLISGAANFSRLLERLDRDLNGGLFKHNKLWERHSQILADFLHGMLNFDDGQGRLLRLYRFEHIPVELLSEVYDRFLGSEGGKKEQGAYYTPRRLAALVVEQTWESLRQHLDVGKLPKILDPSCGSGIFLALLFQRIVDSFPKTTWENLKQVVEHLHGIDINSTAIRISAFSLYVALLHRAEPKELQKLMSKGNVLPDLIGTTLLQGDFFNLPIEDRYDFIIGNPPWGSEKQRKKSTGELWARKNKYPNPTQRERSWPFIWKSLAHLPAQGHLALLLPSTGFFLNDVKESLIRLLGVVCLERLVDLSDLRHFLFRKAIFPTCILLAKKEERKFPYKFAYLCPKADLNAARGERILLADGDRHLVLAHVFAANSVSTTQRLMWFGPNEIRLLSYLDTLPTLRALPLLETREAREKYPEAMRPDWGAGLGFQAYRGKGKPLPLPELASLPFLKIQKHTPWVQRDLASCKPYSEETITVRWQNYPEGFTAPHIVTRLSIRSDFRLQASYAEQSYSFMKSLMGITVPDSDEGRSDGKFLTAMLNSAFVAWFMGTLGVGVDRPKFDISDLLPLPLPQPDDLPDPRQAEIARGEVVAMMDDFMRQTQEFQELGITSEDTFPLASDVHKLDDLIFAYLGLRSDEVVAIRENLTLVRKAAQPTRGGKLPALWEPSEQNHWDIYCNALDVALSVYADDNEISTETLGYSHDVVIVCVNNKINNNQIKKSIQKRRAVALQNLPDDLLQALEYHLGGNIYLQRCTTVFFEEKIYVIKPRQRRFWLTSAAYMDAEHILGNMLRAAEVAGGPE